MARNPSLRKWLRLLSLFACALALSATVLASPLLALQGHPRPQAHTVQAWTTIFADGFEGDFPGLWQVGDVGLGQGQYHWGKRDCQAYDGSYSAWAVGGGEDGAVLSCGSDYPNYLYSYMVYGPFSLEEAAAAELTFQLWLNSQPDVDSIFWGFSTDGEHYRNDDPPQTGDSGGWTGRTLDLAAALGEPQVWVAFIFISDASIRYAEGAYIDNVVLRMQEGVVQTPTPTATQPVQQYTVHLPIVIKAAWPLAALALVHPTQ